MSAINSTIDDQPLRSPRIPRALLAAWGAKGGRARGGRKAEARIAANTRWARRRSEDGLLITSANLSVRPDTIGCQASVVPGEQVGATEQLSVQASHPGCADAKLGLEPASFASFDSAQL